jgi:hypothetical protein
VPFRAIAIQINSDSGCQPIFTLDIKGKQVDEENYMRLAGSVLGAAM